MLTVVVAEYRSQLRNREAARARLAAMLRTALAPDPPPRRPTRPSRVARERRLADKRRRTLTKQRRRTEHRNSLVNAATRMFAAVQ